MLGKAPSTILDSLALEVALPRTGTGVQLQGVSPGDILRVCRSHGRDLPFYSIQLYSRVFSKYAYDHDNILPFEWAFIITIT